MPDALIQSVLDGLWSAAAFAVAIVVLVAVHEFGHFWVARKLGVKVLRFSIGFGKPLWRWQDSTGCEYVVAAIPLGGYVKMLDEREAPVAEADLPHSFGRQSVWKRCAIVFAGPLANFLLALVLFWGLFLLPQQDLVPVIGKVVPNSLAAQAGAQPEQEILAVDNIPTATRTQVFEALLRRIGDTGDLALTVRQPGESVTYELLVDLQHWLAGADMPDPVADLGIQFYFPPFVQVKAVVAGGRAAEAGLQAGDIIEKIDGVAIADLDTWLAEVRGRPEQRLVLGVRRDGGLQDIAVTPARIIDPQGATIGQIGVQIGSPPLNERYLRKRQYSVSQALWQGVTETAHQSQLLLHTLQKLVMGYLSPKNLSGPLGIAKVAGDSAGRGFEVFCRMLAILSINLGVVNLLPIPVLDGGLLLLYLVEAAKGSPVPEKIQALGSQIGIVIIASLMLFAIYNDLLRL
ncbi:MAG: RIP metalloprotease RseP [Pseudomonadales bacterium]|nr:RIP metalloprotease RseP [Pseudomonadales bacterium]